MIRRATWYGLLALVMVAPSLSGQGLGRVRTGMFYESYSFDEGPIPYSKITELTVPLGIDFALGRFGTVTLSSGYAKIDLKSELGDQTLSGVLDSEIRLAVNVIPGNLVAIATGVIPTGIKTVDQQELPILGALASDVIGFAAQSIGSGGSIGGGLAGAVPVGSFAIGLGATYKLPLSYQPLTSPIEDLKPGAEFRLRAGLEGPLARRTYLRIAGVFASRSRDELGALTQAGVGNRVIGYLSLNQALGRAELTVYGFDVYRGEPQLEGTRPFLPKGNLIAGGARFAIPVGQNTVLTPRGEYRVSSAAPADPTAADQSVQRLGSSLRFGMDIRQNLSSQFALIVQGGGVTGNVVLGGTEIGLSGFRGALFLEVNP